MDILSNGDLAAAREDGIAEGLAAGQEQGLAEGRIEGREEANIEVARKMPAAGLSAMPSPLNISTQTILRIKNGSPIAKYAEGTHFKGRLVSVFIIVAVYKACTLHI